MADGDLALAHDRLAEILSDPASKPEARVSAAREVLAADPADPVAALAERARETLREVLGPASTASATATVAAAKAVRDAAERARSPNGPTGEPGVSFVLAAREAGEIGAPPPEPARFPCLSRKVAWILADMQAAEVAAQEKAKGTVTDGERVEHVVEESSSS